MGWVHDTGYAPAYDHGGYAAIQLPDGTDTSAATPTVEREATGWRAACDCGWRGAQFYSRREWPSRSGIAPEEVEGW